MKKSILRALCLVTLCLSVMSCGVPVIHVFAHSSDQATAKAIEFAETAYVKKDFKAAYDLLAPELKKTLSEEAFDSTIKKMHTEGYPDTIQKIGYEPVPGQQAMNILLLGKDSKNNEYHYRLFMIGNANAGYKVGGLFRGNKAYPRSPMFKSD